MYVGPNRVQKTGDWEHVFPKKPDFGFCGVRGMSNGRLLTLSSDTLTILRFIVKHHGATVLHQLRLRGVATASRGDINQDDGLEYDKNHDKHVENVIRARRLASKRATRQNSVVQGVQNPERAVSMANRIFGIGPSHANMPASRLVHPSSPFHTVIIACVSTADTRQKRSQTILHGIRILQ